MRTPKEWWKATRSVIIYRQRARAAERLLHTRNEELRLMQRRARLAESQVANWAKEHQLYINLLPEVYGHEHDGAVDVIDGTKRCGHVSHRNDGQDESWGCWKMKINEMLEEITNA